MNTSMTTTRPRTVSRQLKDRVFEVLSGADQPMTMSEVRRALQLRFARSYHSTTVRPALNELVQTGEVSMRVESLVERETRGGGGGALSRRPSHLFYAASHVPSRVARDVVVFGEKLPEQVILKSNPKSRPAYAKKVQTGPGSSDSRPAKEHDVQTGMLREIDRLNARVEELELTIEMMRRLLLLAEKF